MSRNLDDFKKEINDLDKMDLDNPTIDDIKDILEKTSSVLSEWFGHLESEIEEKFSRLEELEDE